jgi:hypothetical protein
VQTKAMTASARLRSARASAHSPAAMIRKASVPLIQASPSGTHTMPSHGTAMVSGGSATTSPVSTSPVIT